MRQGRQLSVSECVRTAGRHMCAPTCAHKHTAPLRARFLGLRCHSPHTEDDASSRRRAFDSPYWKRSRYRWRHLYPLCICDPCERWTEGRREIEGERRQRDEMIKGQTAADSQKFDKQYSHFLSSLCFLPCRLQTPSENGALYKLCSNFKNDNKQKEARAICSVRQKHSTKV